MSRISSFSLNRRLLELVSLRSPAERRCFGDYFFGRRCREKAAKGHRLGSRQRESGIDQQATHESESLRAPEVERNPHTYAQF
jgi:hypothetical protein